MELLTSEIFRLLVNALHPQKKIQFQIHHFRVYMTKEATSFHFLFCVSAVRMCIFFFSFLSWKTSWLKCCFTSTETVGLLGTGAQDVHLDFHTAPELC